MSISIETLALAKKYTSEHGGTPSQESVSIAVDNYLKENPVQVGATEEQVKQIEKNKNDIEKFSNQVEDTTIEKPYNKINPDTIVKGDIGTTGNVNENEQSPYIVTDFISVTENNVYSTSYYNTNLSKRYHLTFSRIVFFGTDKKFIYQTTNNNDDNEYFKIEVLLQEFITKITIKTNGYLRLQYGANILEPMFIKGLTNEYINVFSPSYETLISDGSVTLEKLDGKLTEKL